MKIRRELDHEGNLITLGEVLIKPEYRGFNKIQSILFKKNFFPDRRPIIQKLYYKLVPNKESNKLVIDNNKKLFQFNEEKTNIIVKTDEERFNFCINTKAITDINETLTQKIVSKDFTIDYKLYYQIPGSAKEYFIHEGSTNVELVPCHAQKLKLGNIIKKNDAIKNIDTTPEIEHKIEQEVLTIWVLKFFHPSAKKFSNPVSGQIKIGVNNNGARISSGFFLESKEYGKGTALKLEDMVQGRVYDVSINIDFQNIENPRIPIQYDLFIEADYLDMKGNTISEILFKKELILVPNKDKTEVCVNFLDEGFNYLKDIKKNSTQVIKLQKEMRWTIDEKDEQLLGTLQILNNANYGRIMIQKYQVAIVLENGTEKHLEHGNEGEDQTRILTCFNQLKNINDFIVDAETPFYMDFKIDCSLLLDTLPHRCKAAIIIRFEYCEIPDNSPQNDEFKQVNLTIQFDLVRIVMRWLGVDFGTSAIAAALNDLGNKEFQLLDLNKQHHKILEQEDPDYSDDNFAEKNQSPFLSSLMYFDSVQTENGINCLESKSIRFSPTDPKFKKSKLENFILPNVKLLMGHDFIPLPQAGNFKFDGNVMRKQNVPVKKVLEAAYKLLFEKYLIPCITELYRLPQRGLSLKEYLKTFGNIVITIPNTYDQNHKELIKETLLNTVTWDLIDIDKDMKAKYSRTLQSPLFFEDQIHFVNESDAVACYYAKFMRKESEKPEYVLIYDFGAGTIDISYIRILEENNVLKIDQLAQIGALSAGNSIDTNLAKIIDIEAKNSPDKYPDYNNADFFEKSDKPFSDLVNLKYLIKDLLKIKLSNSWKKENTKWTEYENHRINQTNFGFLKKLLIHNSLFTQNECLDQYLVSISDKLLMAICATTDSEHKDAKNKIKINKVILSGRGVQFQPIRPNLENALRKYSTLTQMNQVVQIEDAHLKSAVVLGALARVDQYSESFTSKRKCNSYYGIIWQSKPTSDSISFYTFLKPGKTIQDAIAVKSWQKRDHTIEIDGGSIDARNALDITLIKSYVSNPVIDLNQKRSEMVSKITCVNRQFFGNKKDTVSIKLIIDHEEKIRLQVAGRTKDSKTIDAPSIEQDLTYEENTWPFNEMKELSAAQKKILQAILKKEIKWPDS